MTREHTQWDELAVGHALSALEPEDEQAFVSHLRGCARCERTLAETTTVGSHLAYAVESAEPPPALRDSILDAVRASGRPLSFSEQQARPLSVAGAPPRTGVRPSGRPQWAHASIFGLAASLIAVLALGVWNTNLRSNLDVKDAAIARMEQMSQLASDPSTVRIALTSGSGAHGSALVRDERAVVLLRGLPANSEGSTYVLWYQDQQGGFHAVETFDVRETGHVNVVEARLDRPVDRIAALAVSREPGRVAPPTPSFALVKGLAPPR